jgi:hypothetical protein
LGGSFTGLNEGEQVKHFAKFVVQKRVAILTLIALLTVFFLYADTRLTLKADFNDLLPQKHPYVKVHNMIRNIFGGANQVLIMVQVRKGDIFNQATLEKVQWITREAEKLPGVDPYKIRSLASSKLKDFKFSSGSMAITPLMFPNVPQNEKEMAELKDKIYSNPRYYGQYVAYDSKKTLIMLDFFEEDLDYKAIFKTLTRIREHTEDANHIVSIAGEPMHMGYIYQSTPEILLIIGITIAAIVCMLFFYYRSKRAVVIPLVAAFISTIWGLGFMGLMGYNLDPLILVLPFFLSLMTVPHAMQCMNRFFEEYTELRDMKLTAERTIEVMFLPGTTSVITDALGVALVCIAGIPVLVNISITSTFWCIATATLFSLIMTPLLLSFIPETERIRKLLERQHQKQNRDYRANFLYKVGTWIPRRGKWYITGITIIIFGCSLFYSQQLQIGDFMPGSSILWPFHRYNKDAFRITTSIPLLNPLYVIVEGNEGGYISKGQTLREIDKFQRYLAKHDRVMFSYSIVNNLPGFFMSSNEDDPQWCHLPKDDKTLSFICRRLLYAGEPGTWDRYVDMQDKYGNIVVYCRDKMPATVQSITAHINAYLEKTPGPPGGRYLMAGGAVGVQAAIRDVIADSQVENLVYALAGVFMFCALNFRSLSAGFILLIPLVISNLITFALMGAFHVGLTTNTYPISSIGIGFGVDYGIYLLSRIIEERDMGTELPQAVAQGLKTCGRTIVQVATTLTVGLLLWMFSALKFQAEMGVLLAILLFLNMLGALFLVPTLIFLFKPKFLTGVAHTAPVRNVL